MATCGNCGRGYDYQEDSFTCGVCGAYNAADGSVEYNASRADMEDMQDRIRDYDRNGT